MIEWNHHIRRKTIARLLKKKKTVCTGYAYLLKEMCRYVGIEARIVNGYSRTAETEHKNMKEPNHSWNAVRLLGKWYLCDPTWATGIFDPNTFKFDFEYQEGFFLSDPKLFIKNHYPLEKRWTLLGTQTPSFKEFLEGPLVYNAAFNYGISYNGPLKMNNTISKRQTVSFEFDQLYAKEIESVYLLVSSKKNDQRFEPMDLIIEKNSIRFSHQFLHKGFYDLHLLLNDEAILTYTFAVKKDDGLVTVAKAYSGLTNDEILEVSRFVKQNSIEKFGPVRTVKPELVFEIAFEGIALSNRHKSGVALRFPRISRWRRDKPVDEIDTIESVKQLIYSSS